MILWTRTLLINLRKEQRELKKEWKLTKKNKEKREPETMVVLLGPFIDLVQETRKHLSLQGAILRNLLNQPSQ